MTALKTFKPQRGAALDALVVGSGISGLITSALLLKQGRKVHLTDKSSVVGGRYSPEVRQGFSLGVGAGSFGDGAAWKTLCDYLGLNAPTLPITEGKPLLHTSKGWSPAEDLPAWESHLARTLEEFPAGGAAGVAATLIEFCASHESFSLSLESPVTQVKMEHGKVKGAVLGAEIEVNVNSLYWACDYKSLLEAVDGPGVPAPGPERVSWLKKFRKTDPQPGVVLEFAHRSKLADFTETLVFPFQAGDKEERRFLVGSVVSNRDPSLAPPGKSLSVWMAPLTEAEWGDNHESMKKIRSARRLIDKAFPDFEKGLMFERVLVLESTVHPLGKKKGDLEPVCENLFLAADWAMPHGATFDNLCKDLLETYRA